MVHEGLDFPDFEWVTPHFRTMLQSQPHRLHLIQKPRGAIHGKATRHIYRLGLQSRKYRHSWFPGRIPLKDQFFQIPALIFRKNFFPNRRSLRLIYLSNFVRRRLLGFSKRLSSGRNRKMRVNAAPEFRNVKC